MDNCRKTPQRVYFLAIRTFTKKAPPQRPEEFLNVVFKLFVVPGVGIIPLAHGAHPDELCFSELFERERSQMIGSDGLEVVAEEIAQPEVLVGAEILAVAEQQPT